MNIKKHTHRDKEYTYTEANRYLANAKETLGKSGMEYGIYTDSKYVREASGLVYLSALKAIETYLISRGSTRDDLPRSIEEYQMTIKKKIPHNGKLMAALRIVYENLHLSAYYGGGTNVDMVKAGFSYCKKIIDILSKTK